MRLSRRDSGYILGNVAGVPIFGGWRNTVALIVTILVRRLTNTATIGAAVIWKFSVHLASANRSLECGTLCKGA